MADNDNEDTRRLQVLDELASLRLRVSELEASLGIPPADPLAIGLVALASNCVYVAQDGIIRLASPGFQDLVHFSASELEGMHVAALVHPDEAAAVKKMFVERPGEDPRGPGPFRVVTQQGDIRWVVGTVIPVRYRGVPATLGLLVDITEFTQSLPGLLAKE
ncbi:MAG: PAS domain S-box protein [Deltaproteobacteria bacterium]|nr:PAS domain S-box protein [Deltaproteobacteria bacterium]